MTKTSGQPTYGNFKNEKPSPNWNNKTAPDRNPLPVKSPHGGEVKIGERFLGDQVRGDRGTAQRERNERLMDK
jgi:hypothetical protein